MRKSKGNVLLGRVGCEYYFIDSVFDDGIDQSGCTGTIVYPVSESQVDDMLTIDNLEDQYDYVWEGMYKESIKDDCKNCQFGLDEEGCEHCGYRSLCSFCQDIMDEEGIDAVIDNVSGCAEALNAVCSGIIEYVDCVGCGRIFGYGNLDKFDEVYNRKALIACEAYEDGAVSYDYAIKVIFG